MPPFVFCIQDCYYIRAAYQNPRPHRHFAAHVLIGLDGPFITEIDGKHMQATGIAIASNVVHTVRTDADLLVIFIDELTPMARFVKYVLLQGMSCRSLGKETAAAVSGYGRMSAQRRRLYGRRRVPGICWVWRNWCRQRRTAECWLPPPI